MMKTVKFPVTVSEEGVSATIRKFSRIKNGKTYTSFSAEYFLLGKRKQEPGACRAVPLLASRCRQMSNYRWWRIGIDNYRRRKIGEDNWG
jgi:hypothetical protein